MNKIKMKYIILSVFLLNLNFSCSQNKKDANNTINTMQIQKIPREKQITYALELNMKLPYELYINDIKADYDYIGTNSGVDINPYLLKNGKCKIKIKMFPAFKIGKKEISIDDIQNSTILFGKYIMDREKKDIHSYDANDFKKLFYSLPPKPVTSFEQEWEVEVKELPYEIEGWSKGRDLRKMDQKQLEQKVIDFHKKLWQILNDGDYETWSRLTNDRFKDYCKYSYLSQKEIEDNLIKNEKDIREYAKNTMIPLDNYEMKIYADGKLVTLEKSIHTKDFNNQSPLDIYGWNPLISRGKISGAADYSILLYLPQGGNEFVIIRK